MSGAKTQSDTFQPAFAPELRPVSELESKFFFNPLSESLDANGLTRLHSTYAADEGAAVAFRARVPNTELTPIIRPVFVPDYSDYASYLVEASHGGPGLVIISMLGDGLTGSAIVTLAPLARLSDISQAMTRGMVQVVLPTTNAITTTINLKNNGIGDFLFSTSGTTACFSDMSQAGLASMKRALEFGDAPGLAFYLSQLLTSAPTGRMQGAPKEQLAVNLTPEQKRIIAGILITCGALNGVTGLFNAGYDFIGSPYLIPGISTLIATLAALNWAAPVEDNPPPLVNQQGNNAHDNV